MQQFDRFVKASGLLVSILVIGLSVWQAADDIQFLAAAFGAGILIFYLYPTFAHEVRRPVQLTFLWLQALAILGLYFSSPTTYVAILSIVWIVQFENLLGSPRTTLALAGSNLAYFAAMINGGFHPLDASISVALFLTFQVFAVASAARANREQKLREETAALNRELMATRQLLSQSAAQNERIRIARDLHDLLGHHMTALIMNLEVAAHQAREVEDRDLVVRQINQAHALAKLLMGDIRTAVGELRSQDAIRLEAAVEKLLKDIPRPRFIADFSGAPEIANLEIAETLLRCIQEGITNVLRHSRAEHCLIELNHRDDDLVLSISDDGTGPEQIQPGNGLTGMQERLSAIGGSLSWQGDAEGFRLEIQLPGACAA